MSEYKCNEYRFQNVGQGEHAAWDDRFPMRPFAGCGCPVCETSRRFMVSKFKGIVINEAVE